MIGVIIVPTGLEAQIGGHAGDANPVAKLIASCCNKLIIHPNVVNASDINEMPENCLYVEGSILDRFLESDHSLLEVKQNKILIVVNSPVREDTINAVSAARVTIGIDAEILELKTPLVMKPQIIDGVATGEVEGYQELARQVNNYDFDALAIHTPIGVPRNMQLHYYRNGGVNPWGGVEAKASKLIATLIDKPVAHAPLESVEYEDEELYQIHQTVVDPRMAPEAISFCYLHSVLKGLHKAPRISDYNHPNALRNLEVDFMISPYGCWGRPHIACQKKKIPIIIVKENKCLQNFHEINEFGVIIVNNYWEAAGLVMCMQAGVHRDSVRRPIKQTLLRG